MPQTAACILFISEYCVYSMALLKEHEHFNSDLTMTVVRVDDNSKKTKALIDAYDIRGVPTLVINNEKHSEGQDVFATLLPVPRNPVTTRAPGSRVVDNDFTAGRRGGETAPLDFDAPMRDERDGNTDLKARLQQLEVMRKQADDHNKQLHESVTNQQMMASRQCDPIDDDDTGFGLIGIEGME